jgi:hypothetical protein
LAPEGLCPPLDLPFSNGFPGITNCNKHEYFGDYTLVSQSSYIHVTLTTYS